MSLREFAVEGPQVARQAEADCCLLVAVKARAAGKSRLAGHADAGRRARLVRRMLQRVLAAAAAARCVAQVLVVSPERDEIAADIPVLADDGSGLNQALAGARRLLQGLAARPLIVLPADLPRLDAADVDALAEAGRASGCAIAPDRCGSGTNGLFLADADGFEFQFGPDSRARHVAEARRSGREPAIVQRPGLEFDVDRPSDLWEWIRQCPAERRLA